MDALRNQVEVLTNELTTLKAELINIKGTHANLHQQTSDANTNTARSFAEQRARLDALESGAGAGKDTAPFSRKPLIKPEQVDVKEFKGSMTDSRACFLEWCEKVSDRVELFEDTLVTAMMKAERTDTEITADDSVKLGVSPYASKQLHGVLKDNTSGTAAAVIRGNTGCWPRVLEAPACAV